MKFNGTKCETYIYVKKKVNCVQKLSQNGSKT